MELMDNNNNGWISAEERLPEKSGWYNVITKNGNNCEAPYAITLSGNLRWVMPDTDSVIYWKHRTPPKQ